MLNKLKYCLLTALLLITKLATAQGRNVEMADAFREDGKIYVVVLVAGIIFAGIVVYLIVIDRRLRKLEKENER